MYIKFEKAHKKKQKVKKRSHKRHSSYPLEQTILNQIKNQSYEKELL